MYEKLIQTLDLQMVLNRVLEYLPKLFSAFLLIIVFWILSKLIRKMTSSALTRTKIPAEVRSLVLRFIKAAVLAIGILTVSDQLGINIASLIAGVSIAGLAISFASQDTIANVISGVVIIIDRPYGEGDWISIGDLHAMVTEIRLRTTVLTTFDNETVVIPNKQLAQERVVNYTLTPKIRVCVPIGIAYKEDMEKARRVMLGTLEGDTRVMTDPEPVVWVLSLGDSSVNMELRFWTKDPMEKFTLAWEYTEKCKRALDEAGIEIPFPHRQVFIEPSDGLNLITAGLSGLPEGVKR